MKPPFRFIRDGYRGLSLHIVHPEHRVHWLAHGAEGHLSIEVLNSSVDCSFDISEVSASKGSSKRVMFSLTQDDAKALICHLQKFVGAV